MFVVKDLVPDMTNFYQQYKSIKPWLIKIKRINQKIIKKIYKLEKKEIN